MAQLRTTYRLGYRTDLAVEGRWIGQDSNNNNGYTEYGLAVEGGYYLTPDLRLAAGYSFGSVNANGDTDFSGYRSNGGLYLNISLKLNELLGGFGLQKPVPKQQQESTVQAVTGVAPSSPPPNPFPTNPGSELQPQQQTPSNETQPGQSGTPDVEFQQPQQPIPSNQTQPGQSGTPGVEFQQPIPQQIPSNQQQGTPIVPSGTTRSQQLPQSETEQRQIGLINRLRQAEPQNNNALSTTTQPREKPSKLPLGTPGQQQLLNRLKQQKLLLQTSSLNQVPQANAQGVEERSD